MKIFPVPFLCLPPNREHAVLISTWIYHTKGDYSIPRESFLYQFSSLSIVLSLLPCLRMIWWVALLLVVGSGALLLVTIVVVAWAAVMRTAHVFFQESYHYSLMRLGTFFFTNILKNFSHIMKIMSFHSKKRDNIKFLFIRMFTSCSTCSTQNDTEFFSFYFQCCTESITGYIS